MHKCEVRHLGRIEYGKAFELQQRLVEQRKQGLICDQLLLLEHPHTITLGRNGKLENLLGSEPALRSAGITFHTTDRGGDITYHGPGQVVGYPILDLREWKRDVGEYMRAIEQVMMDAMAEYGIAAGRIAGCTGAWVNGAKIGAHSLVGAGALITEGKEFPDNSVIVGAPAKLVREADDTTKAMTARAADVYVRRWKRYAAGLMRLG